MTRSALVTGAGGGLGRALVTRLIDHEWTVFAADLERSALELVPRTPRVVPVLLNVTDPESIRRAYHEVANQTDHLDGIINFAGVLAVGSMIDIPEEKLHRVLDVNVLGTYRTNKAFFPLVKACRGRIINISSETGWQSGAPFNGAYAMSKHAIEAYSDSLRRELALLGVKVIKIQPGPFKTDMLDSIEKRFTEAERESTHFSAVIRRLKKLAAAQSQRGHDPDVLARVLHTALTTKQPEPVYSVRPAASRAMLEWLPRSVADRIWLAVLRRASEQ